MTPDDDNTGSNKRSPGRPRLYETSSGKVDAFRNRQQGAGYLRKEVLVTKPTADRLAGLAKDHGVSTTDVASALLEYGLERFELQGVQSGDAFEPLQVSAFAASLAAPESDALSLLGTPVRAQAAHEASGLVSTRSAMRGFAPTQGFSSAPVASAASLPAQAATAGEPTDDNPITRFFARRKESLK